MADDQSLRISAGGNLFTGKSRSDHGIVTFVGDLLVLYLVRIIVRSIVVVAGKHVDTSFQKQKTTLRVSTSEHTTNK